ncbi:hypothetical protein BGZ61DRAFT_219016 [Ilyonectria robusta]|uniref:uncharacterized protein n=1 Tax=Ilyonectria robusta TaxID=1079257 RepID=UPI001E8DBBBD|nr:uncharacterized protein BGZ61DRAFT_219016 [Ilyonectria robusta]KAH8706278.1 hypothetical protein BGZ61DRAFT_219016 [Ilyonectria robusta]
MIFPEAEGHAVRRPGTVFEKNCNPGQDQSFPQHNGCPSRRSLSAVGFPHAMLQLCGPPLSSPLCLSLLCDSGRGRIGCLPSNSHVAPLVAGRVAGQAPVLKRGNPPGTAAMESVLGARDGLHVAVVLGPRNCQIRNSSRLRAGGDLKAKRT